MKRAIISGITFISALLCACSTESDVVLEENNIPLVIGELLSDEKAMLMVGVKDERHVGAACASYAIPRLGIPAVSFATVEQAIVVDSVSTGAFTRPVSGTFFPESDAIAATWDTEASYRYGEALGEEAKCFNIDILVSQPKDSLMSPYLEGMMTSACIQGIQHTGTGACLRVNEAGKAVEIAVKEAQPRMLSINCRQGSTPKTIRTISDKLRKDWGWKGLLSEWGSRMDTGSAAAEGCGMYLPGKSSQYDNISRSIKDTLIKSDALNQRVTEMLEMVVKASCFKHTIPENMEDSCANAALARDLAAESMVLLENRENALPVTPGSTVAFFGIGAFDIPFKCKSLTTGFTEAGFNVNQSTAAAYQARINDFEKRYTELPARQCAKIASEAAKESDIAVIVAGNRDTDDSFTKIEGAGQLNSGELSMIKSVGNEFKGKTTVLVLRSPLSVASCLEFVDAVILAWKPSCEWSTALADILCSNEVPSGCLPNMICKPLGRKEKVAQTEYPLGYGLTYSSFSLSEPEIESAGTNDKIKVMVTNTGNHDLIYTLKVLDSKGSLCAFTKTDAIAPGKAQEAAVTVRKDAKVVWQFDDNGNLRGKEN